MFKTISEALGFTFVIFDTYMSYLPFSALGLGWFIPAFIGTAISYGIYLMKRKSGMIIKQAFEEGKPVNRCYSWLSIAKALNPKFIYSLLISGFVLFL